MCDHFFESCMDAAKAVNIPYIVTASMDLSKGNRCTHYYLVKNRN